MEFSVAWQKEEHVRTLWEVLYADSAKYGEYDDDGNNYEDGVQIQ